MIFRDVMWGLCLWGILTLVMPGEFYYWTVMVLGVLTMIGVCIIAAIFFMDWLYEKVSRL